MVWQIFIVFDIYMNLVISFQEKTPQMDDMLALDVHLSSSSNISRPLDYVF